MTKEGLRVSVKGFLMDLKGIREMEAKASIEQIGYDIARVSFELLSDEIKNNPFKDKYEIEIFDDKIEKESLTKIADLVLYHNDEVNKEINENVKIDGIRRIWIGATYSGSKYGLKVRLHFENK